MSQALDAEVDLGCVAVVEQKSGRFFATTLQFMVPRNEFQEDTRLVVGQWCSQTTTKKKNHGMHFMCGAINRAYLWAFAAAVSGLIGPSTIHTDSMWDLDGLWRED